MVVVNDATMRTGVDECSALDVADPKRRSLLWRSSDSSTIEARGTRVPVPLFVSTALIAGREDRSAQ